jgi:uncharacterized damage-inducible protein DinB
MYRIGSIGHGDVFRWVEDEEKPVDPLKIYDYLVLARGRIFDAVRPLDDAAYRRDFGIGLGSLARTLHHCRGAEVMYMRRIAGDTGKPGKLPVRDDPEVGTADALPFGELERLWGVTAAKTRDELGAALGDGWMVPLRIESSWDGEAFAYEASPSDFFVQLLVHEVHHRTQAVHMLHRLGVSVGEIDYSMLMIFPFLPND